LISTCLNCGEDTHAVHATKGADRVFLSLNIHHGVEELNKIKSANSYSSFLQMKLIQSAERKYNKKCRFTQSMITEAIEKITTTSQRLIQAEEDAKEERIRIFTENENHQLREYRMKANLDKENLLRILRERANTSGPEFDTFSPSFNEYKAEMDEIVPELPTFSIPSLLPPAHTRRTGRPSPDQVSRVPSNSLSRSKGSSLSQNLSSSLKVTSSSGKSTSLGHSMKEEQLEKKMFQDDILFDMEGYQNEKECKPFFESDEESEGESTSLEGSGGFMGNPSTSIPMSPGGGLKQTDIKIYASSVPVPVPLFNNMRDSYEPDSDDEMKRSPSLSKLAVSFKQVARSMQDSTGVFGELPSKRKEYSNEFLSGFDDHK